MNPLKQRSKYHLVHFITKEAILQMAVPTTTTTETLFVIREVVPLTATVDTSTSPFLFVYNCLSCRKANRALFPAVATTIEHSDTNGQATAAITRSSRLPMGMNGIVSEQDFDSFCAALNEQINAYDAILTRRRKYILYRNLILYPTIYIIMMFVFGPLHSLGLAWIYVVLIVFFAPAVCLAVLLLSHAYFQHPIQQVIHEQNEIYQNVNDACSDFTKTISTDMTVSPSSSSSPAPTIQPCIVRITCTLESLACKDDIGPYNNMDHIKFMVTTKTGTTSTTDEHHHDMYMDTPALNHVTLNDPPTVTTNLLHIV